jgi:hypothetical protein
MGKTIAALDAYARDLLLSSMEWSDKYWDEGVGLLWAPANVADPHDATPAGSHMVRNTIWYALGLLMRNGEGDNERAAKAISAVLDYQLDEPGRPFHGTFYRAPEEAHPPVDALEWKDYDPNWREFIMTTVASILIDYEGRLPASLVHKIDGAFPKAVAGALARGLPASYTNIALMHAFMLCYAGKRLAQPAWFAAGEAMGREIYRQFKQHDTFAEYNSPTYYGVDVYALAQWRAYAISPLLNELGAEMEALLWTDIARYYHAGLRNICGPYDRAYGMDMRQYVAVVGEWIWLLTGRDRAPMPDLDRPFAHSSDFNFAPAAALLGAPAPAAARAHFLAFRGERQVERIIADAPRRVATAWLDDDIMIGAEDSSGSKKGYAQFHSATVHWRIGADQVGWMRLVHSQPLDARASSNRLDITGSSDLVWQIHAPGASASAITHDAWTLPGLSVRVETSLSLGDVAVVGDHLEIHYAAADGVATALVLLTSLWK